MQFLSKLRTVLAAVVALSVTFFFTGCLQVERMIKVKPDGSGTITMTMVMTKEALAMMKELSKESGADAKSPFDELASEEKAKEQAEQLGEGVKFEKVEKISNNIGEGARMTFSFTDITKLKARMDMSEMGPGGAGNEKGPVMAFEFTKGSPAKLVVKILNQKADQENKPDDPTDDSAEFAQAAQIMKGMKLTAIVEVEGQILDSDAAHRAGSRVTFADIPYDEILKEPAKFKAMNKVNDWAEAVKILKDVPSVKMEPKETVTIQFK